MNIEVQDFQTRFILPFEFNWSEQRQLAELLLSQKWLGKILWEKLDSSQYLDNVVPNLSLTNLMDCFRLTKEASDALQLTFEPREDLPLALMDETLRAEVFLSRYGSGVFSIAVTYQAPTANEGSGRPAADSVLKFNHLHHLGPEEQYAHKKFVAQPRPLVKFQDASGVEDTCPLIDLIDRLLPKQNGAGNDPRKTIALRRLQRSLSVYTVVRLPHTNRNFHSLEVRQEYADLLGKLQRLMLPRFAGVSLESITKNSLTLNDSHWMCVGNLAAAHLLVDQPFDSGGQDSDFNGHRLHMAMEKMFFVYLFVLQQRLALQTLTGEAITLIDLHRNNPTAAYRDMERLRKALMDFTIRSQPELISNEDNSTNIYHHCQQVLGVCDAQVRLHRALADVDAQRIAHNEMQVQHNFHWLELLIFAVYAIELATHSAQVFGVDLHRPTVFSNWGLLIIVVLPALVVAAWHLDLRFFKPLAAHDSTVDSRVDRKEQNWVQYWNQLCSRRVERRWMSMLALAAAVAAYVSLSSWSQRTTKSEPHPTPSNSSGTVEIKQPGLSIQIRQPQQPLDIKIGLPDPPAH